MRQNEVPKVGKLFPIVDNQSLTKLKTNPLIDMPPLVDPRIDMPPPLSIRGLAWGDVNPRIYKGGGHVNQRIRFKLS